MISQAHWENRFYLPILWDCITSLTSAQMSSELDDINDSFLAHSADDNEDLAFGSDGEGSDYKQRRVYFASHVNVTRSRMWLDEGSHEPSAPDVLGGLWHGFFYTPPPNWDHPPRTAGFETITPGISVFSPGLYVEFHTKGIFDMESKIWMEIIFYVKLTIAWEFPHKV